MKNKSQNIFADIFLYRETEKYDFTLPDTDEIDSIENSNSENELPENISSNITENLKHMKVAYNSLINSDIVIRDFTLLAHNKEYKAFIIYIDGMVDSKIINDFVLKPLMLRNKANTYKPKRNLPNTPLAKARKVKKISIEDFIYNNLIPQNSITKYNEFKDAISDMNSGNCLLFVDKLPMVFSLETKGFKSRSIGEPNNEIVVRGSQEAFVEAIRTNTSILRRLVNNENLIIENLKVGKISKTNVAVCYIQNITSNDLVAEVKFRINNLDIDSLLSSGQLEQLIQDDNSNFPQLIATERPDKTVNHLFEGRVAILVNGNPYALVVPGVLVDFMSSPEDLNLKPQYSNILRIIRLIAVFFALLLPGLYISITSYHQELIPTPLLFAIASSRETVPFPIFFEIILMEVSFELIREAGLRVPSAIGPTIGIVGALILGEAAVSAGIVSPILIIIVAITGICSFAVPDFSLSFSLRFLRFIFLLLGYFAGLLGIATGLFIGMCILTNLKSFGAQYTEPYIPSNNKNNKISYFLRPIWKREQRATFLNPKKKYEQGKISMLWKKPKEATRR